MVSIQYRGYEFVQNNNTDRYRIFDSNGKVVVRSYKNPNMPFEDAIKAIESYIALSNAVKAVLR